MRHKTLNPLLAMIVDRPLAILTVLGRPGPAAAGDQTPFKGRIEAAVYRYPDRLPSSPFL